MTRSKRLGVAVIAAVAVIFTFVGPKTGWFERRPQYESAPTCGEMLASPTVEDALKVAFSTLAGERRETSMDLPDHPMCAFQAQHPMSVASIPSTGEPFSRSLHVSLDVYPEEWTSPRSPIFLRGGVREARQRYRADNECKAPQAEGPSDESGLGDEAISCWTVSGDSDDRLAFRHVIFRQSNINVAVEMVGSDYMPAGAVGNGPALRANLEQNTRCIAEVLADFVGARVTERHTCGASALSA
ncbi:hypothetical protein [Mycobacteroides salmoniphilum]|uniref:hypothetical protein n=1 Tax=Mycobacteroides salmoniphilum TaxID=404941 RepID=UPI001F330651|nr:hypothetical protein [Mycobacteroides salmoniphilum]